MTKKKTNVKRTNNNLQSIIQKSKDRATRTPLNPVMVVFGRFKTLQFTNVNTVGD
jgi:hypothetical protein